MTKYQIITDGACDMSNEEMNQLGIDIIPLLFEIGGKSYYDYPDEREMSAKDFYALMRGKATSKTGLITPNRFYESALPYYEKGIDVLFVIFSSGISGTYSSAVTAKSMLEEQFPERKCFVVDSLCATLGVTLLLEKLSENQKNNMSIEENVAWIEANKMSVVTYFTVDDLMDLKRGGRLSLTSAILGTFLNFKPIIIIDDNGKLVPVTKFRARKKALLHLAEVFNEIGDKTQPIYVSHADDEEAREFVIEKIHELCGNDIIIKRGNVGPVIGSHTGPTMIIITFFGSRRKA